jgi:hypothetical protein
MMFRRVVSLCAVLWFALLALPVQAAVTITFWSHDQDENFPHAFFALKGTPDAGGQAIDANYGFTAKAVTPAILIKTVGGKVEDSKPGYMRRSDARFSVVLTDPQYAAVQSLVVEWTNDSRYNLNKRNCVHFVAEAARRAGLTVPSLPKLMKKPKSFLLAVGESNPGRVTQLNLDGDDYFAAYGAPAEVDAKSGTNIGSLATTTAPATASSNKTPK